jgi:lysozyme family protein
MKVSEVGATKLKCHACSYVWQIPARAYVTSAYPFVKRSGMVMSCPQCKGSRNLKIVHYLRKDFQEVADFEAALPYILKNEGTGYEGPPATDQPTNSGIISADVAQYRKVNISTITVSIMMRLTQQEIHDIYLQCYWNAMRLSEINDQAIATAIFDCGVNRGIGIGAKYAQRVCNMKNLGLVIDGKIGDNSLVAINQLSRAYFIQNLVHMMDSGYDAIAVTHPEKARFLKGWLARSNRLLTLI